MSLQVSQKAAYHYEANFNIEAARKVYEQIKAGQSLIEKTQASRDRIVLFNKITDLFDRSCVDVFQIHSKYSRDASRIISTFQFKSEQRISNCFMKILETAKFGNSERVKTAKKKFDELADGLNRCHFDDHLEDLSDSYTAACASAFRPNIQLNRGVLTERDYEIFTVIYGYKREASRLLKECETRLESEKEKILPSLDSQDDPHDEIFTFEEADALKGSPSSIPLSRRSTETSETSSNSAEVIVYNDSVDDNYPQPFSANGRNPNQLPFSWED